MFQKLFNWRFLFGLIAILIVALTIYYSQYLAKKIAAQERQKVTEWVTAGNAILSATSESGSTLAEMILTENKTIPIIETNEQDSIIQYINVEIPGNKEEPQYLEKKLADFKSKNQPIIWRNPLDLAQTNKYYYGESRLLLEVKYYPIVAIIFMIIFLSLTIYALNTGFKSTQNQLWAGMAKETAHQLGTPVSSLQAWIELLKDKTPDDPILSDMEKDVQRLNLISDRFGKIGSKPKLENCNLVEIIHEASEYMRQRASGQVKFNFKYSEKELFASISPVLFTWVLENLLKNALDALDRPGTITIHLKTFGDKKIIDIADTGKGIPARNIPRVFKPGFSTKKRGWGLGLTLCKRIINHYHKGDLFVKWSVVNKGTCFRIILD